MASYDSQYLNQERLFYFTGKIRAFWKDKIFFLDPRNAAIVGFEDLYINGSKASQKDLHHLDAKVANTVWEDSPNLHSYVGRYDSSELPPWPYKLKGKKLWMARYAWIGPIPEAVEEEIQNCNVVYMPLTYYTGKLISLFDDKILYGDYRNNVMVHLSDLCVHGQSASNRNALQHFNYETPVLHSFIVSLDFLTHRSHEGPEPHLPTWPVDNYGPNTWVAKFAWQGEMPLEYRNQLSRFHIIKITEWGISNYHNGNVHRPLSIKGGYPRETLFSVSQSAKQKEDGTNSVVPLLPSTHKEAAIVKGSLLVANDKYGLINSCFDVIVFSTKNFYVNGEIFREGSALDDFFHERKVPLTVWIEPLPDPVLIFDVYVMWRAVCVWYGIPPKNMEAIKKRYDKGIIAGTVPDALNTTSDNRYTLVLGEVTDVSHNLGIARAKVGKMSLDIIFRKKAVYIEGYKLHTKSSLMEVQSQLQSGVWTMLVYPSSGGSEDNKIMYTALAIWQYSYQHFVSSDLLHRIVLEGGNASPECDPPSTELGDQSEEDKNGRHMTGMIIRVSADYGILETRSVTIEPSYVFFLRKDLYVDGQVLQSTQINSVDKTRQVNLFARAAKRQEIKGFPVTMYATLLWIGKKPQTTKATSQLSVGLPTFEGLTSGSAQSSGISDPELKSSEEQAYANKESENAKEREGPTSPHLEHKLGHFVHLEERYGIIRCDNKTSYSYVLFDFSVVWVHGEHLATSESLHESIIRDKIYCDVLAYSIPKKKLHGHHVSMSAAAVWLGKKPLHFVLPTFECPVKAMEALEEAVKIKSELNPLQKKISEYVIKSGNSSSGEYTDITNKVANISLKDSAVDYKDITGIKIDPNNPYIGKHVSGRILKLMRNKGIAIWRCGAKEGEIYILFNKENIFVNLCPMDDNYRVSPKSCNFFVIPIKHQTIENYKVSLYATCGWIGSKPHAIPSPGDQGHPHISLDDLFAVEMKGGKNVTGHLEKLMKDTGIARWRSVAHGGDIFIEFQKKDVCDTIQCYFDDDGVDLLEGSRPCHFYVKPMEQKEVEGYVVSLQAICGWMGKKPPHFPKLTLVYQPTLLCEKLHVIPVDPSLLEAATVTPHKDDLPTASPTKGRDGIRNLDSVLNESKETMENKDKKKKKNKPEVWEEDSSIETSMEGKIVELHSNVGRLQGADGNQHYFCRENSYLYGVCLNNVELWHVLVQDEMVNYRLTELSAGQSKVSKMWIGEEKLERDVASAHIYEWCKKHIVPDGARDLLIHQLELS